MFLPYTVDVPMARVPIANWVLIAVTTLISCAIFAGVGAGSGARIDGVEFDLKIDGKKPSDQELEHAFAAAMRRAQETAPPLALVPRAFSVTQLVTSLFVHADFFHLLGNMIFLFVFGNAVNAKMGHAGFLGAYVLLGALGGLGWLLLGDGQPVVGASGAIMGLVGIFLVLFPRNDVAILYFFGTGWTGTFRIPSAILIALYLGCDLWGSLSSPGGGVAYVSHLAGGFGGIALAIGLLLAGLLRPERYEQNLLQVFGMSEGTKPATRPAAKKPTVRGKR